MWFGAFDPLASVIVGLHAKLALITETKIMTVLIEVISLTVQITE